MSKYYHFITNSCSVHNGYYPTNMATANIYSPRVYSPWTLRCHQGRTLCHCAMSTEADRTVISLLIKLTECNKSVVVASLIDLAHFVVSPCFHHPLSNILPALYIWSERYIYSRFIFSKINKFKISHFHCYIICNCIHMLIHCSQLLYVHLKLMVEIRCNIRPVGRNQGVRKIEPHSCNYF